MTIRWLCVLACCVPVGAQGEGPVSEGKQRVHREVREKRDAMRAGNVIRTNVRVSVRLKNGNKLLGVVKNELFIEALDRLDFVAANMETPGAGIRVWYYNETNSYIFLPYVEIEEYHIQSRLSDAQVKVIEDRLEASRLASESRRAEQRAAKEKAEQDAKDGKNDGGDGEAKTDEGKAKPGTEKGAAAEEHARMRKLLEEFPPEQGYGEDFIKEVERKKVVLGVFPDEKAKRFIEVFGEWKRAREVLKPDDAGTGDKAKPAGGEGTPGNPPPPPRR